MCSLAGPGRLGEDPHGGGVPEEPGRRVPGAGNVSARATPRFPRDLVLIGWIFVSICSTPLKKVASPEDVANQIVILSSQKVSGHVSGHVLMVEGGMEGRLLNSRQDLGL